MLRNIKVGPKLITGFLIVSAITAISGVVGIRSVKTMNDAIDRMYKKRVASICAVDELGLQLATMRSILYMMPLTDAANRRALNDQFNRATESAEQQFKILEATLLLPACHDLRQKIHSFYNEYVRMQRESIAEIMKHEVEVDPAVMNALSAVRAPGDSTFDNSRFMAGLLSNNVKMEWEASNKHYGDIFLTLMILVIAGVLAGIALGWIFSSSISKPLTATVGMIHEMSGGNLSMRLNMDRKDEIGDMAKTMDSFAERLKKDMIGTMKMIADGDLSVNVPVHSPKDEISPVLKETIESLRCLIIDEGGRVLQAAADRDLTQRINKEYRGEFVRMRDNINTVVANLNDAMGQVGEVVGQVTSASGEISQGAQSLAESANEQASSLEEISSSLEEMASMTKQNADNSNQAKLLVAEAGASVNEANEAMTRMAGAIREIKTSSDNTAKILKTIDDIAFQTNLLALNAAVEAARAGEAGKGFAVVAEEVRNLAMRSAEAAKNTADMIEESVKNAESGVKITEDVAKALNKTVERSSKVNDLIAEIAAASNEQAQGIEQVNTAVAEMNRTTQQNAANSEESASAAEELSSQASELANMVDSFKLSAAGGRPQKRTFKPAALPHRSGGNTKSIPVLTGPSSVTKSMRTVKVDDIIPLDDDELALL